MKRRDLIITIAVALAASGIVALPPFDLIRGLSTDTLFALRHATFGARYATADSRAVVVALDEETYRRSPFKDLPKVMWTRQIARVMNAVIAGGASVVGYDVIFPTSVERYVRGFDREFLIALRRASKAGKVVLAKVQHQAKPISPFPGYSFAVGHHKNIRTTNVFEDDDGVIRRVPLLFRSSVPGAGERIDPSMALELAARASGRRPVIGRDGSVAVDGYRFPDAYESGLLVNFDTGAGTIPTYSLADLFACAEQGRREFFREHFAGRVVFVGAVLDVEDRKLTSRRFVTGREDENLAPRCVLPVMRGLFRSDVQRDTIPGVYIHAAAVNNLLRGDGLRELGGTQRWLTNFSIALAAAISVMLLSPLATGIALVAAGTVWTGVTTVAFQDGLLLPLFPPIAAMLLIFIALAGYRFAIADKDKRYLRRSFALYLPPAVVDRLADSGTPPALGGETRELTAFFSDIAGFTTLSEGLSPQALVRFLNAYLSVITDTIEAHGGFVDKYIGDATVGVFGAPLADADHARHAVQAALDCQRQLAAMRDQFGLPGNPAIGTRIGINSGDMLVGNIGSNRRFNYTIMGDAVNLASRLEGANKAYGTSILVSDRTVALCGDTIVFRDIDRVRVIGREAPVGLFEPRAPAPDPAHDPDDRLAPFAVALGHYRAGRFDQAAKAFGALAADDSVARVYVERIERFRTLPPAAGWDGVTDLKEK